MDTKLHLGLSFGTEFEQFKDLFVNLQISNFYEDLETSSNANDILKNKKRIILKIYLPII